MDKNEHYIIEARDKKGALLQRYDRFGHKNALKAINALIENPTWTITVRQA